MKTRPLAPFAGALLALLVLGGCGADLAIDDVGEQARAQNTYSSLDQVLDYKNSRIILIRLNHEGEIKNLDLKNPRECPQEERDLWGKALATAVARWNQGSAAARSNLLWKAVGEYETAHTVVYLLGEGNSGDNVGEWPQLGQPGKKILAYCRSETEEGRVGTLMHEMGHTIGLNHTRSVAEQWERFNKSQDARDNPKTYAKIPRTPDSDPDSIMVSPRLGASAKLSAGDKKAVAVLYPYTLTTPVVTSATVAHKWYPAWTNLKWTLAGGILTVPWTWSWTLYADVDLHYTVDDNAAYVEVLRSLDDGATWEVVAEKVEDYTHYRHSFSAAPNQPSGGFRAIYNINSTNYKGDYSSGVSLDVLVDVM